MKQQLNKLGEPNYVCARFPSSLSNKEIASQEQEGRFQRTA